MTASARVLVISDQRAIRLLLQQTLEHSGCTAIPAEDCRAAVGSGDVEPPHLILLDEDTFRDDAEAFQALADRFPDAIIAALAAPVRRRNHDVPEADCLIEKPVDERALLRAVRWSMALLDGGAVPGAAVDDGRAAISSRPQ